MISRRRQRGGVGLKVGWVPRKCVCEERVRGGGHIDPKWRQSGSLISAGPLAAPRSNLSRGQSPWQPECVCVCMQSVCVWVGKGGHLCWVIIILLLLYLHLLLFSVLSKSSLFSVLQRPGYCEWMYSRSSVCVRTCLKVRWKRTLVGSEDIWAGPRERTVVCQCGSLQVFYV